MEEDESGLILKPSPQRPLNPVTETKMVSPRL
jgi:hypothetical protein